jgi:hypothetical protein
LERAKEDTKAAAAKFQMETQGRVFGMDSFVESLCLGNHAGWTKGSMENTLENHTVLHKGGNPFHQQLLSSWDRSSLVFFMRPCDGMSLLLVFELLVVQSVVSCDV